MRWINGRAARAALIFSLVVVVACSTGGTDTSNTVQPPPPPLQREVAGIVTGLDSGTLEMELQWSAADGWSFEHVADLAITQNGGFIFPSTMAEGAQFVARITVQPEGQTCFLGSTSVGMLVQRGDVAGMDPGAELSVTCSGGYTLAGTYQTPGPMWWDLVLSDADGHHALYSSDGFLPTIVFPHTLEAGEAFAVSIVQDPFFGRCALAHQTGTAGIDDTTALRVTCEWGRRIFVEVSGLAGSGLVVQDNFGHTLPITHNATEGRAWFPLLFEPEGTPYSVTVLTQPAGPAQTCSVTNGTGTLTTETVVTVFCAG